MGWGPGGWEEEEGRGKGKERDTPSLAPFLQVVGSARLVAMRSRIVLVRAASAMVPCCCV